MTNDQTEQYKAGWNLFLGDANSKLPLNCKKNFEFLDGFNDCRSDVLLAVSLGIRNAVNPVYPSKK